MCVFIVIIITIIFSMFHCLLICRFYKMVYVYIAVMSVLTRDKFLNFIVETIKNYLILSYLMAF